MKTRYQVMLFSLLIFTLIITIGFLFITSMLIAIDNIEAHPVKVILSILLIAVIVVLSVGYLIGKSFESSERLYGITLKEALKS